MKARALYYLLVLRARALACGAALDGATFLYAVVHSLEVVYSKRTFTLTWQWQEQKYTLIRPGDRYTLYRRGDRKDTQPAGGVQDMNWRLAVEDLACMADECKALSLDVSESTTFKAPSEANRTPSRGWLLAVMAGFVLFPFYGIESAIETAITALIMIGLLTFQRFTHLGREVSWSSLVVAVIGVMVPVFLHASPLMTTLLALFVVMTCQAELHAWRGGWIWWAMAGGCAGLILWPMCMGGWVIVLLEVGMVGLIHLIIPIRISRLQLLVFSSASLVSGLLCLFVGPVWTHHAMVLGGVDFWIVAMIMVGALLCFGSWWILGTQTLLFPWLAFLLIAVTLLRVFPNPELMISLTGFSGFVIIHLKRLVYGFKTTSLPLGS